VSAYVLRRQTGIGQGFDLYDDALPAASPELPLGQVQRPGARTVENAIQWIDQRASSKFFLFLHIYEPHRPYAPPARFKTANPYDGEVEYADEIVGQLVDHLRTRGLYERATIVLLADHGEGLGDHGEDEHGIFLYRETIRVPLVIKLPGSRGAGRRVADPVQHIDVAPTLIDLAGLAIPAALGGRSLRPALEGSGALPPASIYSEALSARYHFGWSQLYALADERYRFIRAPRDELYDIAQDPGERRSIATERPQVRLAMRGAIEPLIAGAALQAPSAVSDPDRQKLAALGYVGTQSNASLSLPGDRLPDPKDKVATLQEYKRATELAGDRRYAEATAIFRRLLQTDPEMTDVWLQLAGIYERRGMIEAAVGAYKEIIKRNPKDAASLTGAAAGLLRLGELDEARAHAELALTVAPAAAHELLARIAVERGDAETARREATLVSAVEPDSPVPDFIEGLVFYRQQQYAAAVSRFLAARQKLTTRTVQMSDVDYYLADSSGRLERYDDAERYFLAEISHFPDNLRARAGLAMLYRSMGRDAAAEGAIAALVRQAPTREGYDLAAQLWTMFGETRRAAAARAQARRPPG
jgi:choline-sulfatase